MKVLSVVIPTLNESENIVKLVPEIEKVFKANGINGEVVVVDDKSPDGTAARATELNRTYGNVTVIERARRDGLGNALKRGVEEASGDFVVFMDADLSHEPAEIPKFLKALERFDVVVGSRFLRGSRLERGVVRKIISGSYNLVTRNLLGVKVADLTSGYRAFDREKFRGLKLDSRGPEIHSELVVKATLAGLRVGEIPVSYVDRTHGSSKLNYFKIGPGYSRVMVKGFLARVSKFLR